MVIYIPNPQMSKKTAYRITAETQRDANLIFKGGIFKRLFRKAKKKHNKKRKWF